MLPLLSLSLQRLQHSHTYEFTLSTTCAYGVYVYEMRFPHNTHDGFGVGARGGVPSYLNDQDSVIHTGDGIDASDNEANGEHDSRIMDLHTHGTTYHRIYIQ